MTGQEVELMKNMISPKRGQREADHQKCPANREESENGMSGSWGIQQPWITHLLNVCCFYLK